MGLSQEYSRATLHLPVTRDGEFKAYTQIITHLETLSQSHNSPRISGFTVSNTAPAPHIGYWWNSARHRWDREQIATVVIDYKVQMGMTNDRYLLEKALTELKTYCLDRYRDAGHPQKELWVVVERVQLFV